MPVLLVGTKRGLHELDLGEQTHLRRSRVHALARSGSIWWALTEGRHVWRGDGGKWQRALTVQKETLNCILPVAGGLLIGTSEAHLLRVVDGAVEHVAAFDEVPGREKWYTPWGGPPDTRSLARGPDGTTYAGVHVGGVLRSRDDGRTWQATPLDIDADMHQVVVDETTGTVLCAAAVGLCASTDGGDTWTTTDDGLHSPYCRAVAVAGDVVLISACDGPHGGKSGIYRGALGGGGSFERCTSGLPDWFEDNIDTGTLAARGPVAAFGGPDGTVYMSADAGEAWAPVAISVGAAECLAIA